jgi:hypothetical protein
MVATAPRDELAEGWKSASFFEALILGREQFAQGRQAMRSPTPA